MPISAGRLRNRVRIEKKAIHQIKHGPDSGSIVETWDLLNNCKAVPAEIAPLKGREFIASQQLQSQVSSKIIVRYMNGLDNTCRMIKGETIYNVEYVMVDPKYGSEYLVAYVSSGVNKGQ